MDTGRWTNQIDATTSDFQNHFGNLTEAELNWKPDSKTWSVAQNLHHLMVINKTYFPVIDAVRNTRYKTPWIGKINFMVNFFGNTILKSVSPDRKRKMKTFPLWEPSAGTIEKDILKKFASHQDELKALIVSSSDLLDQGKIISSPANKNIVYTLKCAFDIIVTHERRHLEQAKETNAWRIKS